VHPICNGNISQVYTNNAKAYKCWFTTPFPDTNYNFSLTGLSSAPFGASGLNANVGYIRSLCAVDKQLEYVVYSIGSSNGGESVGIGFIRYHEVKVESISWFDIKRLTLGGEVVSTSSGFSTSYPGFKKFTGLFVKQSSTWKPPQTTSIKQSGVFKTTKEISIKHNGAWERVSPPDAYSNWINMLDLFDDALDFAVQVHALD
jgi:hypothetical protein